ncbi:MAG: hypothetical protein HUJ98_12155, partial [Bacteroidaceae bacterium]|nr:hypothetical protein [Bacteroidaceae bacterium]
MDISMFMTNWIWTADWTAEDDKNTHIVYFRKMTELQEVPSECKLKITADSCYKLYINGQFVEKGPQKAINLKEWFVDTVDITAFLKPGKNVAAVEVIRFPENCFSSTAPNTNDSLLRTPVAHLFVQTLGGGENKGCFDAKNGWKACVNRETEITGENSRPAPIHVQEKVNATECFKGWKESYYDDSQWKDAKVKLFFDLSLSDAPMNQVDRTIPFMKQEETRFMGTVCFRDEKGDLTEGDRDGWNNLINKTGVVVIPANTAVTVELAAKYLDCGYLDYSFWNGKNASVETLCSECYGYPKEDPRNPLNPAAQTKGDRTDYKKGKLLGFTSTYKVAGYGTEAAPENYEPFWFRTFRYIQLKITTKDEPLVFANFSYRATGYP